MKQGWNWRRTAQAVASGTILGLMSAGMSPSSGIHILIELSGEVELKKVDWEQPQKAHSGNTLGSNDELTVGSNGSATVYCSTQNQWKVTQAGTYSVSNGCPSGEPAIKIPDSNNDLLRPPGVKEEALQRIPYLISPRQTSVLSDSFSIEWNAVPEATSYKVTVGDWEVETSETQIPYTGELNPDAIYLVSIEADSGVSSLDEDDGSDSWFVVLGDEEANLIKKQISDLKQQGLTSEQEGLVLAHLYRGRELNAEAIKVLEGLVESGSRIMAVHHLLGDIYQQVGLTIIAKNRYEEALDLAEKVEDIKGRAAVQKKLGELEHALGDRDEAVQWLEKAQVSYSQLGMETQAEAVKRRINSILGKETR